MDRGQLVLRPGRGQPSAPRQDSCDISKQNPSERLYLVAHSHGGNVALKALSTVPDVQTLVSGVVCISTPFIDVERRRGLDLLIGFSRASWLFWLACLLLGLVPTLLGLGEVTRYGAFLAAAVFTVWLMLNDEPRHFIDTYKARASEHVSDFLVTAVCCPLLVLRVQRDEALLWVAAFDRISGAANWLAATVFKAYLTAAVIAALATTTGGLTFLSVVALVTGSESIWRLIWWIVSGGLFVIALGAAVIPLIAAISLLFDLVVKSGCCPPRSPYFVGRSALHGLVGQRERQSGTRTLAGHAVPRQGI